MFQIWLYSAGPKTGKAHNRNFTVYEKIFCVNFNLFVTSILLQSDDNLYTLRERF